MGQRRRRRLEVDVSGKRATVLKTLTGWFTRREKREGEREREREGNRRVLVADWSRSDSETGAGTHSLTALTGTPCVNCIYWGKA